MGGVCSRFRKATVDGVAFDNNAISESLRHTNVHSNNDHGIANQSLGPPRKVNGNSTLPHVDDDMDGQERKSFSFPGMEAVSNEPTIDDFNDGIPHLSRALSHKSRITKSKKAAVTKVSEVSSVLGRASTAGLGKAVDVLDTLGSSVTNINFSGGFTSAVATKGNKISILAFEVANTIVKGAKLMECLSKENIKHLKVVVLPSEGVQNLVSRDMDELLRIAAADKREELKTFFREVVRFGNRCKDPQWHNLDRYFAKLDLEHRPQKQAKEEAEMAMKQLMSLVQYTSELYHELHALDRFDQDYRHKLQEDSSNAQQGDSLAILRAELKIQTKQVRNLKKKSLWSKILEQVIEKLVDVVHYLHLEIHEAFGSADGDKQVKDSQQNKKKLGYGGLALHYANVINQIDTLVSRSSCVPPNTRDALYHGLPPNVTSALRSKLQSFQVKEEFTVPQIKAKMEKTLKWLVPIATNTTKAHHGFGWVGEWANTGSEVSHKPAGQTDLLRIETLHHADKDKTEAYILELVVWLHHLVSQTLVSARGIRSPVKSPIRSPNEETKQLFALKAYSTSPILTVEDQQMLREVGKRKLTPGISKSQEFDTAKSRLSKHHRQIKSSSHSPINEAKNDIFFTRRSSLPVIDFDIDRRKALDVIDRVDSIGNS